MKQKEKTVKDWLSTLKEPYKTKVLKQLKASVADSKTESLITALYKMFFWEDSLEGDAFWREYVERLENKEI